MKTIVFGEGLMEASLLGDKTFTIRRYKNGYHLKAGEIFIGEFKDGLTVLLQATKDTKFNSFKQLKSLKVNQRDTGYYFNREYFRSLKSYCPDLTWDDLGAVIFFEVFKVEGVPAVKINHHAQRPE